MPSEASIVSGDQSVESLRRELAEAREQQAATADILRVISSSPTDLQPVFAEIAASAARLCDAYDAVIRQVDGEVLRLVAHHGPIPTTPVVPLRRGTLPGRAALERRTIHVADCQAETEEYPEFSDRARRLGFHTMLGVPLIRTGEAIGTISIRRTEVRPFTDRQIALVETFADQAVIAIENTRLFEAEQASKRELQESLEYQTATSEVLNVISCSPSQLQPVVDAIVQTAKRLCSAERATLWRWREGKFDLLAHTIIDPALAKYLKDNPIPPDRTSLATRAVLEGRTMHVPDLQAEPELGRKNQVVIGKIRTLLAVPLLRKGEPIGVLSLSKSEVEPFSDTQIALVETFADQAVIAIENTRLFEAEQARTREVEAKSTELAESLEYQTATSEVLSVISKSPNNLQPVLDAIVATAHRLCQADYTLFSKREADGLYHCKASVSADPKFIEWLLSHPIASGDGSMVGIVAVEKQTLHFPDALAEPRFTDLERQQQSKARTMLGVPLVRGTEVVGVIFLARTNVQPFTDRQIALVTTFADQAIIAIENTRLFEAEQASKRELQESLEYQTATSEVLNVIGRSPTELQPVLDAIAATAARLCESMDAVVWRVAGGKVRVVAQFGSPINSSALPLTRRSVTGRAIVDRKTIHVHDLAAMVETEYPDVKERQQQVGHRTTLATPLLSQGEALGAISVRKNHVHPFSDRQIALLQTFADQAVIAIENARLFEAEQSSKRELQESLEYQTATSEVLAVISRSQFDLKPVLDAIARVASSLAADDVLIQLSEGDYLRLVAHHGPGPINPNRPRFPIGRNWVSGRAIVDRRPIHVHDLASAGDEFSLGRELARQIGHRTTLAIPLLRENEPVGCLTLRRFKVQPFSEKQIAVLQTFADQAMIAIENTRLFEEIAQKSRELEIASQHKSQFVANMSHELRTPLAAILGYAELMQEGFYGSLSEKSTDALTRIRSNGKHLLGLINTVLDIAKIESGQFSLNPSEYAIENVVETVRAATESLAETKKISLKTDVAKKLPIGLGDEQRLTQVLLNLVGNAIKFTDAGEVRITATAMNGHFTVAVTDTGPGIPQDQLTRVFDQFHQVDSSNTKAKGGTGLGLAIAKQIVEMHGGRIWVESTLGHGAAFQMQLPIRAEFREGTA